MDSCYLEFQPHDDAALARLWACVESIRAAQAADRPLDEASLWDGLDASDRARFAALTPEEWAEWNAYWAATPVAQRHSPHMPQLPWDFASLLEALQRGEYQLLDLGVHGACWRLGFEPWAWPFGGTDALVALVEAFGHHVVALDGGQGRVSPVPRPPIWQPQARRSP